MKVNMSKTQFKELLEEYISNLEKDYDSTIEKINIVPRDMSRAFLNIINNACYATNDKKKSIGNNFVKY